MQLDLNVAELFEEVSSFDFSCVSNIFVLRFYEFKGKQEYIHCEWITGDSPCE